MTRRQRWHLNPQYRDELRELLTKPFFLEALGIVTEEGRPKPLPALLSLPTGADLVQLHALENSKNVGFFDALDKLTSLAANPPLPTAEELKQWRHEVQDITTAQTKPL